MLTNRNINIVFMLAAMAVASADIFGDVSGWWYLTLIILYSAIQAYGSMVLDAQFFLPVKFRGATNGNAIAITFDDGPVSSMTRQILDILNARNVKAAFFCIGQRLKDDVETGSMIHNQGHLICNHSYFHGKTFDLQSAAAIANELIETDQVVKSITGRRPLFFRPPYGVTNPMVAGAVNRTRHTVVGWTIRSFDTVSKDADKLWRKITAELKAGDVVLFHDYSVTMIEMLPRFIDHVNSLGLKIVRLDELLNEQAYADAE